MNSPSMIDATSCYKAQATKNAKNIIYLLSNWQYVSLIAVQKKKNK